VINRQALLTPLTRVLTSETLNTTSSSILFIATPLIAITDLNATATEVGIIAATGTSASLLLGLSAGALADRLDRAATLWWCGVARLVLVGMLAMLAFMDVVSIASLCIVGFALSAVKLLFDSVVAAVIPTIVPRDSLTRANSWYEALNSTASALGPAVAGWMLQSLSAGVLFAVNAMLYLASTLTLRAVRLPRAVRVAAQDASHLRDIAEGIRLLWRHDVPRTIAIAAGCFNAFHAAFLTVFTLYAVQELGFSVAAFGSTVSLVALTGMLGALCAPRIIALVGARAALVGSLLLIAPLGVPILFTEHLVFSHKVAVIAACLAAWDFMIVVHVIIEQTIRQVVVDCRHIARVTATTRFVSWGADPIGALLGGIAAGSAIGNRGVLLVCLFGFAASGAILLGSRGVRQLNDAELGLEK
jgi:MFS family permease